MRFQSVLASAVTLFSLPGSDASSAHRRLHQLHKTHHHGHGHHHAAGVSTAVEKRGGSCQFPTDDPNLVAITPGSKNAGWAMSPDQECVPDSYCPIACKPGMVMAQWDPDSSYHYPQSMNGGLYCDKNGKIHKPIPDSPYCVQGAGTVKAVNKCAKELSWCQTVLPGNEAMLIPTLVQSIASIAVPDTSYWDSTAAHFYINPPGVGEEGCVWGDPSKPIGNWTPFVAGANTDSNGQTFVKLGKNPIWESSSLSQTSPGFGVRIECPDGGCNGLPCEIGASLNADVDSNNAANGAGGAPFCVVTVSKGKTAHVVTFDGSGGPSDIGNSAHNEKSDEGDSSSTPPPPKKETPPPPPPTTSSQESTTTPQEPTTSTTPEAPSTTESTTTPFSTTETTPSSTPTTSSTTKKHPIVKPGIFHENSTTSSTARSSTVPVPLPSTTDATPPPKVSEKKAEAGRQQGSAAVAGLVVAIVAAACLF